jgi:hypothetical protein
MEKETWENPTRSNIWIKTFDPQHNLRSERIKPQGKIAVSVEERLINQDLAWDPKDDVFKNGTLVPMRLIESAEDYAEHANNPNNLSESDMVDLFKLSAAKFKDRLEEIENIAALDRIVELSETDSTGATMAQVKAAAARLDAVNPSRLGKQIFKEEKVTTS